MEPNEEGELIAQAGRGAAIAGRPFTDNPYYDEESWKFIVWLRGFKTGRTIDPGCSKCGGTGKLPAAGEPPYEFTCLCNATRE